MTSQNTGLTIPAPAHSMANGYGMIARDQQRFAALVAAAELRNTARALAKNCNDLANRGSMTPSDYHAYTDVIAQLYARADEYAPGSAEPAAG